MSATADGGGAPTEGESAYFRAIEDAFVRLRGAPLLLSPADFQVATRWGQRGCVPLGLWSPPGGGFCQAPRAWRQGRSTASANCAPPRSSGHGRTCARCRTGTARSGERDAGAGTAGGARRGIAGGAGWARRLERRLLALAGRRSGRAGPRTLEDGLLVAVDAALEPAARERLDDEVGAILEGLRERFPAGELEALRGQLHRQRLRRLVGLPVLTLF